MAGFFSLISRSARSDNSSANSLRRAARWPFDVGNRVEQNLHFLLALGFRRDTNLHEQMRTCSRLQNCRFNPSTLTMSCDSWEIKCSAGYMYIQKIFLKISGRDQIAYK